MSYIFSFLFAGLICMIGQLLYEKTKWTPGHIVTLFVVVGAGLSFFQVYDVFLEHAKGGAIVMITNYGHLLYQGGLTGLKEGNLLSMLMSLLSTSSATLSYAVFLAVLAAFLRRPKP